MNKNRIGAVIVCDDVRQEINGKQILIGVYTSDIITNNVGVTLYLTVWTEYTSDKAGNESVHFRFIYNKKAVAGVQINITVNDPGSITGLATPRLPLQIPSAGELIIEMSSDGKNWIEVKRKKVKIAPVAGTMPVSLIPAPSS